MDRVAPEKHIPECLPSNLNFQDFSQEKIMAKKLDLSGKRYGRLDVLEEFGISRNNKTLWKCLCDCGNEIIVIGSSLISGNTKSCGCLHLEQSSINGKNNALKQLDDISGNTYGKIVVKEFSHTKNGKTYWLCLCDCGKEFITRAGVS